MLETNINWIGSIPKDWEFKKIKNCGSFKTGKDYKDLQLGSIPVYGSSETPFEYVNKSLCNKKAIAVGRKGTIDQPFTTPNKFWAVDTCLYNTVDNKNWNFQYVFYWIKIIPFKEIGTKTAVPSLTQTQVNNLPIAYPKLEQQTKIANYLDIETSKIDRKISILEQKFEKLEEYKQSIIFETVTKGLDSNIEMKDSGIDWIGDIPAHWDIFRLKDVVKYINLPKAKVNTNNYLEIGDIDIKTKTYNITNKDKLSVDTARLAPKGTLLISTVRPNRGGIVITKYKHPISAAFCAIKNPSKFWFYFVQTRGFMNELIKMNMDATYPTCKDMDIIKQVVCVPTKAEQEKIADYLDSVCLNVDKKKEIIKKQINLLKEYKQTIIYEAVTGKMEIL